MSINKTYAVFGLGRYGESVAKELVKSGADVIAVDINEDIVNGMASSLPVCKCADVTDPQVIEQLGIAHVDVVVIAMANSLEAAVMAITLCKEVGVKNIIAKCASEMHEKILNRIGADTVVFPERESGARLAKNLLSSGFVDLIELSDDVSMIELDVKPEWEGKTLIELNLRRRFSVNVVAIRRDDRVMVNIDPEMALKKEMKLIIVANTTSLKKIKNA